MPIVVENLTHVYQQSTNLSQAAIEDISLTAQDGECIGIIGHTGSGKSTLIQHFNGLLLPTKGRVLVNGRDITQKSQRARIRGEVGMVFQYPEYQLFDETVEKDVGFGPRNQGLNPGEVRERVTEALTLVGMDEKIMESSPFALSGGEKRRVALAGILAMRPKILVLDEPVAGLDPQGREHLLSLLGKLKAGGTTLVLVSHSMDDVARIADRIAVLNRGRLFMVGTPLEVFDDAQRLGNIGLDVPQAVQLTQALRARGVALPSGLLCIQDVGREIIRLYENVMKEQAGEGLC